MKKIEQIVNARLRGRNKGSRFSISIADGVISAVEKQQRPVEDGGSQTTTTDGTTIDAAGGLVTEAFVNRHLHLDKVWTLDLVGEKALSEYHGGTMGGAMTAIEAAAAVKERYDRSWIIENVRRACDLAIHYGTSTIRAFTDVDTKARLEGVAALLEARGEYADRLNLQVVAFPQDGISRDPGAFEYLEEAVQMGADVVGGIPWIEYTEEEMRTHVDRAVDLAAREGRGISMLVDDAGDPGLRTLEYLILAGGARRASGQSYCTARAGDGTVPGPILP